MFLYYDTNSMTVYNEAHGRYESFTPTLDIDEGYIVVCEYTTYDSFDSYDEIHYTILDLYPDLESAKTAGDLAQSGKLPNYANGKQMKYLEFTGWGSALERVYLKKVKVQTEPDMIVL
jgi:hypothetical protein